jgi:dTDP-4-amino-4,6-dideoxygalactose transaminase
VVVPGFKYNMMDIQAAIGLRQLPMLDGFIEKRTGLVGEYYDRLGSVSDISFPDAPDYWHRHAWHLLTVLVPERDVFIEKMKTKNVGVGMHYVSAHLFSYYQKTFGYRKGDFPHAEKVGESICSLPLFPSMTQDDLRRVVKAVKDVL